MPDRQYWCSFEVPTQKVACVCVCCACVYTTVRLTPTSQCIHNFQLLLLYSSRRSPLSPPAPVHSWIWEREQDSSGQLHIFRSSGNTELEWMSLASAHTAWSKCVCGCQCLHSFASFHWLHIYQLYFLFLLFLCECNGKRTCLTADSSMLQKMGNCLKLPVFRVRSSMSENKYINLNAVSRGFFI